MCTTTNLPAPSGPRCPEGLGRLNAAPEEDAVSLLSSCCGSPRWAARVAAHRPYPTASAALAAADEAFSDLDEAEVDTAMRDERYGEPGSVPTALAALADPEASARVPGGTAARLALQVAHGQYLERFGMPFLLSLAEYPEEEALDQVLAALRARLGNTPEEERAIAAEELRKLVLSRLRRLLASGAGLPRPGGVPGARAADAGAAPGGRAADRAETAG